MKTQRQEVTKPTKALISSQYEDSLRLKAEKAMNAELEAVTVTIKINAAQLLFLRRLAVQEVNLLKPSPSSPSARQAHLADESRRRAIGRTPRSYEEFLCSYRSCASKRRTLLKKGFAEKANFELSLADSTLGHLEALTQALSKRLS